MSNKRINGILAPLRQILNEAADRHGFVSPTTTLKPLRIRKTDVAPFTLDEVQRILSTTRPDYRDYFTVRVFTGMRTGEAHGLKWKYVDFENRLVLIRETYVLGEDEYTKTDSSQRDIHMTPVVYEALKRQFEATGKLSEYVFCNREKQPLDNKNFSDRVWYPLLRHLGLAPRRPYQLRHTAATLWLASGEAPEWIARQLGHSSTEMLYRVYSRFVPNLTRQDGSAIDRLLATRFSSGNAGEASAEGTSDKCGGVSPDKRPPAQPPPERTWLTAA
jgi:integrase